MPKRLREKKIDDPEYYEKVWSKEFGDGGKARFDPSRLRHFLRYFEPPGRICDIGSGMYGVAHWILESVECKDWRSDSELYAVDYSYTAKELMMRLHPRLNFILSPAEETPFRSNYFDLVTAGELIEHIEIPEQLPAEMARICKPGGWMAISTVDPHCESAVKAGRDYPEHIWEYTPDELVNYFSVHGDAEYGRVGNYHFVWCRKFEQEER